MKSSDDCSAHHKSDFDAEIEATIEDAKRTREAHWIRAINTALDRLHQDVSISAADHREIELNLLRELGLRAPVGLAAFSDKTPAQLDRDFIRKNQRSWRWFHYQMHILSYADSDKFERFSRGDDSVDMKREAWEAAYWLFEKIGGGRSPVHIRQTIQAWAREFENGESGSNRFPVPTGDPPPVKNAKKNHSPGR